MCTRKYGGIPPGNRKRSHDNGTREQHRPPHGPQRPRHRGEPRPRHQWAESPAAAALAALPAEPAPAAEAPVTNTAGGLDPAVTAEAAACVLAVTQAAEQARQALAAGDLATAQAALDTAREQSTQARRVIKAAAQAALDTARKQAAQARAVLNAASGRGRATGTRPGALRELVEQHLRDHPDTAFTPHQISNALNRSSGAVGNALDTLTGLGTAELVTEKPRRYRLAAAPAVREPGPGKEKATAA